MRKMWIGVKRIFALAVEVLIEPSVTRWFLDYPGTSTPKNGEKPSAGPTAGKGEDRDE